MKLGDAMGALRSTSDQTHKFWAYFQTFTAGGITLSWGATSQEVIIIGLVVGYVIFAHFNRLLVISSQTDARKIWTSIQSYVALVPAEVPEPLKEVPKTNEPEDPARVKRLHTWITCVAALVMLARIPFILWK